MVSSILFTWLVGFGVWVLGGCWVGFGWLVFFSVGWGDVAVHLWFLQGAGGGVVLGFLKISYMSRGFLTIFLLFLIGKKPSIISSVLKFISWQFKLVSKKPAHVYPLNCTSQSYWPFLQRLQCLEQRRNIL